MRLVQQIIQDANEVVEYRDIKALYDRISQEGDIRTTIDAVVTHAIATQDPRALSFAQIANKLWLQEKEEEALNCVKKIMLTQLPAGEDAVSLMQSRGRKEDIPFLAEMAAQSTRTWLTRNDENQQFFRKCVWAIYEIGQRISGDNSDSAALFDLASVEPAVAAYWAKKLLNRRLGQKSPFHDEDLSIQPDPDLEWPGNRRLDLLLHPIFAEHDEQTVTVYQAYSDAIGKAAAKANSLDVPGFLKSRMTWIKPSFLWMMYRSNWAQKDIQQQTILKIKVYRPEFFHLIDRATLSHRTQQTVEDWDAEKAMAPNRIQWDPDRDGAGNALDRRAIQIGIAPAFSDFFLTRAIANIEDITDHVNSVYHAPDRENLMPQEPKFWDVKN